MFAQYKNIPLEHKAALEAIIRNHDKITASVLSTLYQCALDALDGRGGTKDVAVSKIVAESHEIGTATSITHGWYVQLARPKVPGRMQLCAGQKWTQESTQLSGLTQAVYW